MAIDLQRQSGLDLLVAFARAFVAHARWRSVWAVALVGGGALIEGLGILMIVPILGIVIGQTALPQWLPGAAAVMAVGPLMRLGLLLALFIAVMAVRSAVLHARDLLLMRLQLEFVERQRNDVISALAAAPWSRVAALDHAHVTNAMGSEIGRIASTAHFLVQAIVAVAMLAIQLVIAALLSWPLATGAAVVLAAGLGVTLLRARRVQDMGGAMVRSSQAMMGSTNAFLGGLKSAAAEGATERFVREFADVQRDLGAVQQAFARTQAMTRLRFALGSAIAASVVVFAGVATATPASALITLILLFSRMGGPALQLAQSAQNIQFGLPSFSAVRALRERLGEGATEGVPPVVPPPGPIALHGAAYRHPGGGGVGPVDLTIAQGSFVGIIGPSGAGKTSLVDLSPDSSRPTSGKCRSAAHRSTSRIGPAGDGASPMSRRTGSCSTTASRATWMRRGRRGRPKWPMHWR